MTRLNKIQILNDNGEFILYHFRQSPKQRTLVIDSINELEYKTHAAEQRMANEMVDLMYWELTHKQGK